MCALLAYTTNLSLYIYMFKTLSEIYSRISFRNIILEYQPRISLRNINIKMLLLERHFSRAPPVIRMHSILVHSVGRTAVRWTESTMCSMPDNLSWIMKTHKGIRTAASAMEALFGDLSGKAFSKCGVKMRSKPGPTEFGLTETVERESRKKERSTKRYLSIQRAIHPPLQ